MPLSKIQAESMNLADTYAFTGTVSGTGGLVLLSRQVVSSAVSEVVFNNTLITSTYDDYLLRMNAVVPVTDTANQRFQTSGDNGSSFDTNWYSNSIYVRITDSASGGNGVTDNQNYFTFLNTAGTGTNEVLGAQIWLNDVNSTTAKTWYGENVQKTANTHYWKLTDGYFRNSTGAVNYLRFYFSTGNIASGTFSLYGLVKS